MMQQVIDTKITLVNDEREDNDAVIRAWIIEIHGIIMGMRIEALARIFRLPRETIRMILR